MATDEETRAHAQAVWARMRPNSAIYDFLLSEVEITSASRGLVRARLPLGRNHVNSRGTLHGAVSAALVDWAGGMAIAAYDLRSSTGASTDIHISYLSGSARVGDVIEVQARADRVGGSLAFTSVDIRKVVVGGGDGNGDEGASRGTLIATGKHTKFVRAPEERKGVLDAAGSGSGGSSSADAAS